VVVVAEPPDLASWCSTSARCGHQDAGAAAEGAALAALGVVLPGARPWRRWAQEAGREDREMMVCSLLGIGDVILGIEKK